jgi:hypothetical protein
MAQGGRRVKAKHTLHDTPGCHLPSVQKPDASTPNAAYSVHFRDVPFYAFRGMSLSTDECKEGLGGWQSLRGYHFERFVRTGQMQGNLERRWSLPDFTVWNQHLQSMLVPFVDAGRVFDKAERFSLKNWKITAGLSFRLVWNLATAVSFDYGIGGEGNLSYMELGHPF